jgi:DNA-binding transcriptional LysR family regulator
MTAKSQYQITATDLSLVLTLVRTGTLAQAGESLGVDATTVFRSLQRIERGLGHSLFERTRSGYKPGDEAQSLAAQGELVEAAVETAREAVQGAAQRGPMRCAPQVAGTVRISTTGTILHGLVAPALQALRAQHPLLEFEIHTGNELASLTRRDADIAVLATTRPPQHLVGKRIGPIRVALYAKKGQRQSVRRSAGRAMELDCPRRCPARAPVGDLAQTALSQAGATLACQQHPDRG